MIAITAEQHRVKAPLVRQPRGLVKAAGVLMPGWVSFDIDSNTMFQADTFRVLFALSGLPSGYGPDWWLAQQEIDIELFAGFPPNPASFTAGDLKSVFYGRVDDVTYEASGFAVEVSGRDLTGALIDTKTTQKFTNMTSSAIAAQLATAHGLRPVVTPTKTRVGLYYQLDNTRLQNDETEWSLLTWLAREEGFVTYVRGRELHFEPAPSATAAPYVFEWTPPTASAAYPSFNGASLKVSRSLTLAKDIKVTVQSWNRKTKKAVKKVARASHAKSRVTRRAPVATGEVQTYSYVFPGLTPEQAQQRANQLLLEKSQHELKLEVSGPADNELQSTSVIKLRGTNTLADTIFYPDSIRRTMSVGEGYLWTVEAKNHSPESEPSL